MEIGFLINNINEHGGVERVTAQLANYFSLYFDYKVTIYSLYSSTSNMFFSIDENVKIMHMNFENHQSNMRNIIHDVSCVFSIFKGDILICQNMDICFCSTLLKRKLQGKLIICEHSSLNYYTKKRMILNYIAYYLSDATVFLTEFTKKQVKEIVKRKLYVIPNAISLTSSGYIPKYDSKNIISVGRLEHIKGFDLLIEAFSRVSRDFPEWKLMIYGEGSQRLELQKMIDEKGLSNQIVLCGLSNHIEDKLIDAGVFALSSREESFGLVLMEAKEYYLPSISFDLASIRELASSESTIFINKYKVDEYANALRKLISDRELRCKMGYLAKKDAEKYKLDNICQQWKKLFEELIKCKKNRGI